MPEARFAFQPLTLDLSSAPLHTAVGERTSRGSRTTGKAGALIFGPYWRLPRGSYKLTAYHRSLTSSASGSLATLHVWCGSGLQRISASPLSIDGITEALFTLGQDVHDIEFAIMVEADAALEFDRYELEALTTVDAEPGDQVNFRDFGYNLPFKHIVSLGTHCYTASALKRQGWKRFSGPFDWIFSTPAMVRHCIEDEFKTFLDRSLYDPVPVEERIDPSYYRCHHRFYREAFGVEYVFNHHDVWTDEGYRYLQRCVARFLAIARGADPVLFVQTRWQEPDTIDQFEETCALIDSRFPKCTLNAFAIGSTLSSGVCPELRQRRHEGLPNAHRLFELTPVSMWDATAFQDPLDELVLSRLLKFHRLMLGPFDQDQHP